MSGHMEPGMDIFAAIDRTALKKRSTLRAWMAENYVAFKDRLQTGKPDWSELAKVFVEAGLLDARGNKPTAEAARKTWYRLKADTAKLASTTQPPKIATTPSAAAGRPRPAKSTPPATVPGPDDDEGGYDFFKPAIR